MNLEKKVFIGTAAIIIAAFIGFGSWYLMDVSNYKRKVKDIKIGQIELSKLPDGEYTGSYDVNYIAAKVRVSIFNHRITKIKLLEHKNERGKRAEVIPAKVVKAQSLKVDTITGATNSSKVILKAIELALKNGEKS